MRLQGNLEDVTIIDVLQILGLTGKSGLLCIDRPGHQAEIGFVDGRIATASLKPHRTFMTSILLERGELDFDSLHHALQLQKQPEGAGKPIGSLLLDAGSVTREQLQRALHLFIQRVINSIAAWTTGEFSFTLCAPPVGDDLSLVPSDLALDLEISPQELLLEATRVLDEARHRRRDHPDHETEASLEQLCAPGSGGQAIQALLLTDDLIVQHGLTDEHTGPGQSVRPVASLEEATLLLSNAPTKGLTLLVDTDHLASQSQDSAAFEQQMGPLHQAHPETAIVTFGCHSDPRLYPLIDDHTVSFHVPRPEPTSSAAVTRRFLGTLGTLIERAAAAGLDPATVDARIQQKTDAEHKRLYESVVNLRRSHHSVTVSLEVLRYVAADLERAVLLLAHKQALVVLGVFGVPDQQRDAPGRPVSKLQLPLCPSEVLDKLFAEKRLLRWQTDENDATLGALLSQIGPPVRPSSYLIPLVVQDKVFAVIYADNGDRDAPLPPGEPLGVLVEHGSQLLENLLLRRRASTPAPASAPAPAKAAAKAATPEHTA